jgi:HK97 family phage major capsid protein
MPPTATNGLNYKIEEIVKSMEAQRQDAQAPRNVSLRQYLAEEYDGLEAEALYSELDVDPSRTTVSDLMKDDQTKWLMPEIVRDGIYRGMGLAQREALNALYEAALNAAAHSFAPVTSEGGTGGTRWISPEVFTDPVMRGAVQSVFYPDLVVREVTVGNMTVTMPFLDLSDATLKESGEGATIEEGSVIYADKKVNVRKRARAIKTTYEAIEFNNLDLVQLFFEDFGRLLGHTLNGDAVLAIINGDQEDGSEAAPVIGVLDTNAGITYKDVLKIWARLSMLGRSSTSIIGNETSGVDYLTLPEVLKQNQLGRAIAPTRLKTPLPTMQDLYLSIKVPGKKLVFQDSSASLVQLTARPLMVETEKIVMKQITGTAASIITGFAKLNRNASVVLDGAVAFSSAGWPAWMSPFAQ